MCCTFNMLYQQQYPWSRAEDMEVFPDLFGIMIEGNTLTKNAGDDTDVICVKHPQHDLVLTTLTPLRKSRPHQHPIIWPIREPTYSWIFWFGSLFENMEIKTCSRSGTKECIKLRDCIDRCVHVYKITTDPVLNLSKCSISDSKRGRQGASTIFSCLSKLICAELANST